MNLERYNRQILLEEIGESGQRKISEAGVLVIGAGGIGCPVLSYLASAGVGKIGIVDFDKVDESNLHRQVLYNEKQVGSSKAMSAAENLCKLNSEIEIIPYDCFLNSKNGFEITNSYDIIADASDNFNTRYLINDICVIQSKPFVTGSINKFEAQAAVLNYNEGPTYRCIYPEFPKPDSIANCEEAGVIGALCGLVGTIISSEIIKMITGAGEVLSGKVLLINLLTMEFRKIKVKRNQASIEEALKLRERIIA